MVDIFTGGDAGEGRETKRDRGERNLNFEERENGLNLILLLRINWLFHLPKNFSLLT